MEQGKGLILQGDCRTVLPTLEAGSVNCCVTSPPYWGLRDYGHADQIGLESTPQEYVEKMVAVFREVRRVLRDDGTLWLNLGSSYSGMQTTGGCSPKSTLGGGGGKYRAGSKNEAMFNAVSDLPGAQASVHSSWMKYSTRFKQKDMVPIPWMVAMALQADGWYLRQDIIWAKPNPMPESVTDRCTKSHEYLFLLAKSERYYMDMAAIAETAVGPAGGNIVPVKGAEQSLMRTRTGLHAAQERAREAGGYATRNRRTVWTIATRPYSGAHFATFPEQLVEPCILAGSPLGGTVLDPFAGTGTVMRVAEAHGRKGIGIELSPDYCGLAESRVGAPLQIHLQECD